MGTGRWRWASADTAVVIGAILLLAYLALVPIVMLVVGSVSTGGVVGTGFTLKHFERVLADRSAIELLATSVAYAGGATIVGFLLGTAMAFVVERTDVPQRNVWYGLALVPLVVPGVVNTISWLFLLSPEIGWVNAPLKALFGVSLSIYTLPGMIWVEGLQSAPFAFVLMGAAFRHMDPSLEEAGSMAGGGVLSTLRDLSLPLLLPTIGSVLLILFVRTLESFEVPAILGLPGRVFVYTSRVYSSLTQFPPDYGLSSAYAVVLLVLSVVGIVAYQRATTRAERFATVTGKAFRPRTIELGSLRWVAFGLLGGYVVVAVVLPFVVLVWSSLLAFYSVPSLEGLPPLSLASYASIVSDELTRTAALNSVILGLSAATVVMTLTAVIGWVTTRSRVRGRRVLDVMAFIPITIPGIVLGISLIWVYFTVPIRIYGTLWILLVAYVTRFLPYGIRSITGGLAQIHRELEEASSVAGGSWWRTFRDVTLPLLRPALLAGWLYVFIVSLRELSSSILLYSNQSVVLAIRIFDLRESGKYPDIAALSVLMVAALLVLVITLQRVAGRTVQATKAT